MPSIILKNSKHESSLDLDKVLDTADNFRAREITDLVFKEIMLYGTFSEFRQRDVIIFYDAFFSQIALPFTKLERFLQSINQSTEIVLVGSKNIYFDIIYYWCKKNRIATKGYYAEKSVIIDFRSIFFDFLICLISVISILIKSLSGVRAIIWTGEYNTKDSIQDPRWGDLYSILRKNNISYSEMIRVTTQSPKLVIQNLFRRKLGSFYYQSFWNIFSIFVKPKKIPLTNCSQYEFLLEVFSKYYPAIKTLKLIEKVMIAVLTILRPKVVYSFCITSRSAPLVWAAQKKGVTTVGIMHGMSSRSYMGHEFMEFYSGEHLGNDYYGVWGQQWYSLFQKHSNLFQKDRICLSGPQKKYNWLPWKKFHEKRIKKILIISEQELDVFEFLPYLRTLEDENFEICLKIRPFGVDKFYDAILKSQITFNHKVSDERLEDVVLKYDLVIGTHSTAVLESTLFGIPFLLYESKKWKDLFEMRGMKSEINLYNSSPQELIESIRKLGKTEDLSQIYENIRLSYFGKLDGSEWLVSFLMESK